MLHHDDARRGVGDNAHIVRDDHDRHAEPGLQLAQQVENLGLHRHVERRRRFVGDENLRLRRDRHRDHGALALAARQLVRIARELFLRRRHVHLTQQFDGALACLMATNMAMCTDRRDNLIADRIDRVERRHRLLEDHPDHAAADLPQALRRHRQQVFAIEQQRPRDPRLGRQQPEHRHGRHRLAGAGFADDGQRFAGMEVEIDAVHDLGPAIGRRKRDLEIADLQSGRDNC